jgi:hypothetical protein
MGLLELLDEVRAAEEETDTEGFIDAVDFVNENLEELLSHAHPTTIRDIYSILSVDPPTPIAPLLQNSPSLESQNIIETLESAVGWFVANKMSFKEHNRIAEQKIIDRLRLYADVGYDIRPWSFEVYSKGDIINDSWVIGTSVGVVLDLLEAGSLGEEYGYDDEYYQYIDWASYDTSLVPDWDNMADRRGYADYSDTPLSGLGDPDPVASGLEVIDNDIALSFVLDNLAEVGAIFSQMMRTNTKSLATDLSRMQQLAGIENPVAQPAPPQEPE